MRNRREQEQQLAVHQHRIRIRIIIRFGHIYRAIPDHIGLQLFHQGDHLFRILRKRHAAIPVLTGQELIRAVLECHVLGDLVCRHAPDVVFVKRTVAVQILHNALRHGQHFVYRPRTAVHQRIRIVQTVLIDHIAIEINRIRTRDHIVRDPEIVVSAYRKHLHHPLVPPIRLGIHIRQRIEIIEITAAGQHFRHTVDTVQQCKLIGILPCRYRIAHLGGYVRNAAAVFLSDVYVQRLLHTHRPFPDRIVHAVAGFLFRKEVVLVALPVRIRDQKRRAFKVRFRYIVRPCRLRLGHSGGIRSGLRRLLFCLRISAAASVQGQEHPCHQQRDCHSFHGLSFLYLYLCKWMKRLYHTHTPFASPSKAVLHKIKKTGRQHISQGNVLAHPIFCAVKTIRCHLLRRAGNSSFFRSADCRTLHPGCRSPRSRRPPCRSPYRLPRGRTPSRASPRSWSVPRP